MTAMTLTENKSIRNYWWVFLLEGIAALIFGIILFFQPAATLVILTIFLGAYWLVEGIFKVIGAIMGKNGDRSWWMLLLSGLLGIIGGAIVLGQPLLSTFITQLFMVYLLAFQAIIGGVLSIFWAIRVRNEIHGEGWVIIGGILAILLGILLFSAPLISILTLALVAAISSMVGGIVLIISAFRWRNQAA
jgi:uncharacterized membrane protein HdeD (DUF308 family)